MPKAIKLQEHNLEYIENYASARGMDLSYLRDELQLANEDGRTVYVITDGEVKTRNVTFTTMGEEGFRSWWKFKQLENEKYFIQIERTEGSHPKT